MSKGTRVILWDADGNRYPDTFYFVGTKEVIIAKILKNVTTGWWSRRVDIEFFEVEEWGEVKD